MGQKRKATVDELQKLSGFLNFLNKAIVPGRAFTRRMYAKFALIINGKQLRKHHHVKLDKEFKADCKMWEFFLDEHNQEAVSRPFADLFGSDHEKLNMHSDAAGGKFLGFGCQMNSSYCYSMWNPDFIEQKRPSIEYLELYATCVGVFTWSARLRNRRFALFCDNRSVCDMINSTTSGSPSCMVLIRLLMLRALDFNFRIRGLHIKGKDNKICDYLSRADWTNFDKLKIKHKLDPHPTKLPEELWPMEKVWVDF